MNVSIIVPVRKDIRVEFCIKSLLCQIYFYEYEVIVVENDEEEELKSRIKQYPVIYTNEEKVGSYYARNKGLEIAKYEFVAFIDADCIADSNWLNSLIKNFVSDTIGGVGGHTVNYKEGNIIVKSQKEFLVFKELQYLKPIFGAPYAPTCNVAYRKDLLIKLNGFDTNYMSGGDVDLSWRLQLIGFKLVYSVESIVYFGCRNNFKNYYKQFLNYGMGHVLLFKKFKIITRKKIAINFYPFFIIIKSMFFLIISLLTFEKQKSYKYILNIIEGVALIHGAIRGSWRYKVIYL